jgi:hypothetical protein
VTPLSASSRSAISDNPDTPLLWGFYRVVSREARGLSAVANEGSPSFRSR